MIFLTVLFALFLNIEFTGIDLLNRSGIGMKLEMKAKNNNRLFQEYQIYKNLKQEVGFPEVKDL